MLKLKHYNQGNRGSCAACAYGTVLSGFNINLTEAQCCDEVKTTKKGTDNYEVLNALKKRNIECGIAHINDTLDNYGRWLYLNSINRFLYVCMFGQNKHKRGRPTQECHAVCVSNGIVYDSAHNEVLPLEAYQLKYNHKFIIESIILTDSHNTKKTLDVLE
jgi:hypothetical protein